MLGGRTGRGGAALPAILGDCLFVAATTILVHAAMRRYVSERLGAEAQIREVAELAPAGLAFTDRAGLLRYANAAFFRLFELAPASLSAAASLRGAARGAASPR